MYRLSRQAYLNVIQLALDIVFLVASYLLSYYIASFLTNLHDYKEYLWILVVFIPLWFFCMSYLGMYDKTTFCYPDRIIRNCLFSTLISSITLASMIFFIKETMFSRLLFTTFVITVMNLLMLERLVYVFFISGRNKARKGTTRVIIIGCPSEAQKYSQFIDKTNMNVNIIGYVQVDSKEVDKYEHNLGHIENLPQILKENVVDEVIFALPKDYVGKVEEYILLCEEMGITVRMVLNLYDLKLSKSHLTSIGTLPVLTFHTISFNPLQLFLKRLLDIGGALIGLAFTALISIFIIPAIKLDSPGPIIFEQDRVGLNGRIFKLYKFRSMTFDADYRKAELSALNEVSGGLMFKIKNDPRVTRVGKFLRRTSLDELPQFINVLKGDMSLVGTRPPTVDEVKKYKAYHRRRISIKPGITGLWQISGRSSITDFDEVVKLDTKYIDQWSLWLDIKIIIKTVFIVLRRSGAY
ncbi:sugar transferase [Acetivibrio straminisolvens]|jgi:exopolysaccharide biosynthesis polyprenyl glycosylphosphotransferase|nr:sugar transferase [Acetivibrio straminisolvens]